MRALRRRDNQFDRDLRTRGIPGRQSARLVLSLLWLPIIPTLGKPVDRRGLADRSGWIASRPVDRRAKWERPMLRVASRNECKRAGTDSLGRIPRRPSHADAGAEAGVGGSGASLGNA